VIPYILDGEDLLRDALMTVEGDDQCVESSGDRWSRGTGHLPRAGRCRPWAMMRGLRSTRAQIMDLRRADVVRMGRCDAQCFEWSREIQERDSLRVFGTMFSEEIATPMAANHL
jgi:hypothetical protein